MIDKIYRQYDVDGSNTLDRNETWLFVKDTVGSKGFKQAQFDKVFEEFDKDKNGSVDRFEMVALLRKLLWN